jgi:hypothetical protein
MSSKPIRIEPNQLCDGAAEVPRLTGDGRHKLASPAAARRRPDCLSAALCLNFIS